MQLSMMALASGSKSNVKHTLCCLKFLQVLIFAIFPVISCKLWQIKIAANIFPTKNLLQNKIFSNLNSLHKNTVPRNHVCSITSCLFHSVTKWYYYELLVFIGYCLKICISMACTGQKRKYYQCWVLGKFLKIAKINSRQDKPIYSNGKN